jgi:hypothetical protein
VESEKIDNEAKGYRPEVVEVPPISEGEELLDIPATIHDREVWKGAVKYQFWYSVLGLVLGLVCVVSESCCSFMG